MTDATIERPPSHWNPQNLPSPVTDIAMKLMRLTYGELKEVAEGVHAEPDKVWEWAKERTPEK